MSNPADAARAAGRAGLVSRAASAMMDDGGAAASVRGDWSREAPVCRRARRQLSTHAVPTPSLAGQRSCQRSLVMVSSSSTVAAAAGRHHRPDAVTSEDYARAESRLTAATAPLVSGGRVSGLTWLPDGRLWYRDDQARAILVDPVHRSRDVCDDAACAALGIPVSAPSSQRGTGVDISPPLSVSPDGKSGAFIREHNLWVRDIGTGIDRQLTFDGVADFGYATDNAGWKTSKRAVLLWSDDCTKIATQQQDERHVGEWHAITVQPGHPDLVSWKYPLPGDAVVPRCHRVIIDVPTATTVRLQMPPDFHRATIGDDISMADYCWSPDATQLALISTPRDHSAAVLRLADATTGEVCEVLTESVDTHYESPGGCFRVLWASQEVLWYSQRDDWGQIYLYDLASGALKRQVTEGEGPVTSILRVDEHTRTMHYMANGRAPGQDPYFSHAYRIGLDGGEQVQGDPAHAHQSRDERAASDSQSHSDSQSQCD
jgi:dipeptidyl-peptidase-4